MHINGIINTELNLDSLTNFWVSDSLDATYNFSWFTLIVKGMAITLIESRTAVNIDHV